MTQDEIIEMWNSVIKYAPSEVRITEFAKLVAAKERGACAQVAFSWNTAMTDKIAAEIRARGEALAQPEQEPVAWMDVDGKTFPFVWNVSSLGVQQGSKYLDKTLTPLYSHPQRT